MIDLTTVDGEVRAIRAILFDMDGTIVDSSEVTARLWNGWAAAHGVSDGFVILHGQPAMDTIRRSFPEADDVRLAELAEAQAADECTDLDGVRAMPGALELLAWLDSLGIPWAVVTGSGTLMARARLAAASIAPIVLVSCDDTDLGKPHPEPYLLGARLVGVPVEECLVVEDAPAGVQSGLAAGALTAALNGLPGHLRIHDLRDLHARLAAALSA